MIDFKQASTDLEDRFDEDEILEIWGVFKENYDQKETYWENFTASVFMGTQKQCDDYIYSYWSDVAEIPEHLEWYIDEEAVIRDAKMDWREEYVTDSKGLERIVTWRGF